MKKIFTICYLLFIGCSALGQQVITGTIISAADKQPLVGATIRVTHQRTTTVTGSDGRFRVEVSTDTVSVEISYIGYLTRRIIAAKLLNSSLPVELSPALAQLGPVIVSTGYQVLPRERATGSFTQVDNKTLNEQVSTDVLSRLEAVANGVTVDRTTGGSGSRIMVRGLSTIQGPKDPLIVVDNFPYEGDINNINPNDVESITILKDAAAASIWGARAGNGVIVITTKKGRLNQPLTVYFNVNLSVADKPDLSYIRQMSSSDFIDVEEYLYKQGFYSSQLSDPNMPPLTPVVELLQKEANGSLSAAAADAQINMLRSLDIRNDFNKYMYQPAVNQQYALNLSGGSSNSSWSASTGYDKDISNLDAENDRLNLHFENQFRPVRNLQLTTGIFFTQARNGSGKPGYGEVTSKSGLYFYPYAQFADANGNPLPLVKDYEQTYAQTAGNGQLLNWNYYPLEDYKHTPAVSTISDVTINAGANYKLWSGWSADVKYQYERQSTDGRNLYDADSYFARNLVNQFTQADGSGNVTNIIPKGGILDLSNSVLTSQDIRGQLNYNHDWGKNNISAIGGGELRDAGTNSNANRLYGYNNDLSTFGNVDYTNEYPNFVNGNYEFIPGNTDVDEIQARYVSVYTNGAYTYDSRYTVSMSGRRDASNLFGVNTNKEWNPFWSAGAAWKISDEAFYHSSLFPYLKLRLTYGSCGNIDPSMVAATTIYYSSTSPYTHLPIAQFSNFYNPDLKWETSTMLNTGLDFSFRNDRITGGIEYYSKKGSNLFGTAIIDYTGGIGSQVIKNVAGMKGRGIDLELHSLNITGRFKWQSTLNFSYYHDEVTNYYLSSLQGSNFITTNTNVTISGLAGKPVYSVFAYKWAGLDPQTGNPRGYVNGQVSEDYNTITGTGTQVGDLKYFGSALPTKFGSFINTFSYGALSLNCSIVYKLGYFFRRNSINYTSLFENWQGDPDYDKRWQKPGDELLTTVPSMVYPEDNARDNFYAGSSVLVEKADNVRLQYVNISYDLTKTVLRNAHLKSFQIYFNASNLGLIWTANKEHIDPDYYNSPYSLKPPKTYAVGLRSSF